MAAGAWHPSAPIEALRRRAEIVAGIRSFFAERDVLEVETPALCARTVTDPHLHSFAVHGASGLVGFLQTSPEYAMKRLLAAGSGSIYQIARAYRDGERGRLHHREFSLLEWYRTGWDQVALMHEVEILVSRFLPRPPPYERLSYAELFERHLDLDPHRASMRLLAERAGSDAPADADRDTLLALLLTRDIEPRLAGAEPWFLTDFPESQAALARLSRDDHGRVVAQRFELYVGAVELANGFFELTEPGEQRRRFDRDRGARRAMALPEPEIDERLLAALEHGLPDCAGVALGIDRLVMLALGAETLDEVVAFAPERA